MKDRFERHWSWLERYTPYGAIGTWLWGSITWPRGSRRGRFWGWMVDLYVIYPYQLQKVPPGSPEAQEIDFREPDLLSKLLQDPTISVILLNKRGKIRLTGIEILGPWGPWRDFLQLIWVDHILIYHPTPKTTPPASTGSSYGPPKSGANCSIRSVLVKPRSVAFEAAFHWLQLLVKKFIEIIIYMFSGYDFVRLTWISSNVTKIVKILQCGTLKLVKKLYFVKKKLQHIKKSHFVK